MNRHYRGFPSPCNFIFVAIAVKNVLCESKEKRFPDILFTGNRFLFKWTTSVFSLVHYGRLMFFDLHRGGDLAK